MTQTKPTDEAERLKTAYTIAMLNIGDFVRAELSSGAGIIEVQDDFYLYRWEIDELQHWVKCAEHFDEEDVYQGLGFYHLRMLADSPTPREDYDATRMRGLHGLQEYLEERHGRGELGDYLRRQLEEMDEFHAFCKSSAKRTLDDARQLRAVLISRLGANCTEDDLLRCWVASEDLKDLFSGLIYTKREMLSCAAHFRGDDIIDGWGITELVILSESRDPRKNYESLRDKSTTPIDIAAGLVERHGYNSLGERGREILESAEAVL